MESTSSLWFCIILITAVGVNSMLDLSSQHSITDLYNMIQTMNQTISQMKQNIVNLEDENTRLKQQMSTNSVMPIAFDARLSHGIATVGDDQIIVYDHVVTNIGHAYDSRHGHFTAPTNGLYMIVVSAMAEPNEALELAIVKNGTPIGFVRSGLMTSDFETGTTVMPISLVTGDMIWVRYDGSAGSAQRKLHGNGWNTFSGVQIAAF